MMHEQPLNEMVEAVAPNILVQFFSLVHPKKNISTVASEAIYM